MIAFILLIVILGVLIFVHEAGHFIAAKKNGAYVYEFSLGMGPKLFGWKRENDETDYSIRLFPIGGYCAIAGEISEDDGFGKKLKKNQYMCNKTIPQRCIILIAGVCMNFLTGFLLLFISALIWGSVNQTTIVGSAPKNYPVSEAGIEVGDKILKIDNKKVGSWDTIILRLNLKTKGNYHTFEVEKQNGEVKTYTIKPKKVKDKDGNESVVYGIGQDATKQRGIISSLKYAFIKTGAIIKSMWLIIGNLINGNLSLSALSGPVGVYTVVGQAAKTSIESVIYLTAYLSINLGFINILPIPAFDGGHVLFLIIEGIRKKKLNPKIAGYVNLVGFALIMLLMIIITIKDILNLF